MRRLLLLSNRLRARVHRRVLGQVCFSYHLGRLVLAAAAQTRPRARVHAAVGAVGVCGVRACDLKIIRPIDWHSGVRAFLLQPQKGRERHTRRQVRTLET